MELLGLILYAVVTIAMVIRFFFGSHGKFYEFPFWAGVVSAGWFLPQAIGGYKVFDQYPTGAYAIGMFFAASCNALIWVGFELGKRGEIDAGNWLADAFDRNRLYIAGAAMCAFGLFFQVKLWSLPEEMLSRGQWSGAAVKYLFFTSVFKMGLVILFLLYFSGRKKVDLKLLIFIAPCLFLLLYAALIAGRRGVMMSIFSYVFITIWFVRRIAIPRALLIGAVIAGLILINSISAYRSIMSESDRPLGQRITEAVKKIYRTKDEGEYAAAGSEFHNYVYVIALYSQFGGYDYGGYHWNEMVFRFVPGQIVGREFKNSLMLEQVMSARSAKGVLLEKFGYEKSTGSTISGYSDAFGSFGFLGGIKFMFIGLIMGVLYRYAIAGNFMGQFLYVFLIGTAMQSITHGTNKIISSVWVYFFVLGYPALFWAKARLSQLQDNSGTVGES